MDHPQAETDPAVAVRCELDVLETQRQALLAENAALRRTRQDLIEDIAAAEARHAQIAERTLGTRERRHALAGEVIALCEERAELVEQISSLRIAAIKLEAGHLSAPPPPPPLIPAPPLPVATPEPDSQPEPAVSNGCIDRGSILATPTGPKVASWMAWARSTVKPKNDRYETNGRVLWRQNEDRFRLSPTETGLLAAVADGAGGSGLYCGAWAETLVERLPTVPLVGFDALNRWLDGFCLDFRKTMATQCKAEPPKHSKFVREGSFATLTACWLSADETGVIAHWLGYGDSPLLVFDRSGDEPQWLLAHPTSLAAFDRDPHLLNWSTLPDAKRLTGGTLTLPDRATVVLASDGIGQFMMLRHLASSSRHTGAVGETLGSEFRALAQTGTGRLAATAKSHAARPGSTTTDEQAVIRTALAGDQAFAAMVASYCEDGLLANDDSTVILIDIERG